MIRKRRQRVKLRAKSNLVAVDVDNTLIIDGECNENLVEWIKYQKNKGVDFMLWSARGETHARAAAEKFNITDLFQTIISKPAAIVDDKGWSWTRYSKNIISFEIPE